MVSSPEEYEEFVERLADQTRQHGEDPETIATKSIVSVYPMGDSVVTTSAGLEDVIRVYPKDVLVNHGGPYEYDRRHETLREIAVDVLASDIREELAETASSAEAGSR